MTEGGSQRQLAKILGVSEGAVRKAVSSNRISRLPNGNIDPDAAREAWGSSTDPVRTKVRTTAKVRTEGTHPGLEVRTPADAREAVTLIARVLAEEGMPDDGEGIDFAKARTAELILKARQRELDQAEQSSRLVSREAAEKLFFDTARDFRDAWLAWPARIAVGMADELKVDPRALTTILNAHVKQHLSELGDPPAEFG
jgi:transcriptional regulator with XRE-family HTH domain